MFLGVQVDQRQVVQEDGPRLVQAGHPEVTPPFKSRSKGTPLRPTGPIPQSLSRPFATNITGFLFPQAPGLLTTLIVWHWYLPTSGGPQ